MISDYIKRLGLCACAVAVSACGLFSSDKEIPSGTRIAVLQNADEKTVLPANQTAAVKTGSVIFNQDWSQNGLNSHHVSGNLNARDQIGLAWTASFGNGAGKRDLLLAAPVVSDGKVFAQDTKATVSAFSLADGKKLWEQELKPTRAFEDENSLNGTGLAVDGKAVYTTTGFGSVFALDRQNGKILWRHDINTPLRTAPTVCENKVIVQTLDNQLVALNAANGTRIWKYDVPAEDTVLAGSATPACLPEKNLLISGFSNGEIQAFNLDVGYLLWSVSLVDNSHVNLGTDIHAVRAAPLIDKETIYAVGNSDVTAAIDYRTGEKKWQQSVGGMNMPWLAGETLFILSDNHSLSALNKNNGKILWRIPLLEEYDLKERSDIYLSGPVLINNRLLVTASNGDIYAFSPQNGRLLSKQNLEKGLPLSPVAAQGNIIFTSSDADLIVYR